MTNRIKMASHGRKTTSVVKRSSDHHSQRIRELGGGVVGTPMTTEYYDIIMDATRSLLSGMSPAITVERRIFSIQMQAYLRLQAVHQQRQPGRNAKHAFSKETAAATGVGRDTCSATWKEFIERGTITAFAPPAGHGAPTTRLKRSTRLCRAVRDFIFECNLKHQRTVAHDVLLFLQHKGFLSVEDSEKGKNSAIRLVQRYLHAAGFRRGKPRSVVSYHHRSEVIAQRNAYVKCKLSI